MPKSTILIMPDGVEVHSTADGYHCPQLPALAKVLNFMYPCHSNPRVSAERVGRSYGWRVQEAAKAIEARNSHYGGAGT